MKILHINLQNGWRGGEQQLSYLISGLKQKNIGQALVCKKGSELEKFAKENNVNFLSVTTGFFRTVSNAKKIAQYVKNNKIDIVHCNDSKGLGIAVWSKILFGNASKLILHRHVIFPVKGFISRKIKYSPKYIDKVICVSSESEKVIRKTTENTDIVVISTMTDTNFEYKKESFLSKSGIDTSKKIVGYIAALTYEKDHYTFLNTAKIISSQNPDVHFVIVGSGKMEEQIKKYSVELGLSDRLSFLGFVPQAHRLIPEIDILLFTSTQEGCPTTIIDFFIAKKPVVCTQYPGSTDIIKNGITGFLCQTKDSECLADKINHLLENENLVTEITENAYQSAVETFSVESVTNKIYAVYQEVLRN